MALTAGSPAIDTGTSAAGIPATDQRGLGRNGAVDIGAFEFGGVAPKQSQTIAFNSLPNKTYGDADFALSATASSGLSVSYTATGNASVQQVADVWYVHITGAGSATITAHQAGDASHNPAEDVARSFNISKADATVNVSGYTGVYDAQAHGGSGSFTGVDAGGAALGASLDLGASFTNVPGGTAHWTFHGGDNYFDESGDAAINITRRTLAVASATTQSPFNVGKDGNISFQITVVKSGIVRGQTVADLFSDALFQLTVGGKTYSVRAQAAVKHDFVAVTFRMSDELKSILAANTTATQANKAQPVALTLTALSKDANYSLEATAWTKLFNSRPLSS